MTRLLSTSVCALAVMLAGCGKQDTTGTAAMLKAGEALQAKVGEPGAKAAMPGKDDPDVQAFEAAATKGLSELGTDAMPIDGMDSFDTLCGPATKITMAYVSAGTGSVTDQQAKAAAMNANAERYMDQLLTPIMFAAHCTAVHLPAVESSIDEPNETQRSGMLKVRDGAFQQAVGLLQIAGDPSVPAARRQQILGLLTRDAGNFGLALNQEQRGQLAATADAVAQAIPGTQGQLAQFKAELAKAPCQKLCSAKAA